MNMLLDSRVPSSTQQAPAPSAANAQGDVGSGAAPAPQPSVTGPPTSAAPSGPAGLLPPPPDSDGAPPAYTDAPEEDATLQQAMAASLNEQQEARPSGSASEEDQLMKVLAESVQSDTSDGAGATQQNEDFRRMHLGEARAEGAPVALVSPVPVYRTVALLIQALYASPPVRAAVLAFSMPDSRTRSLDGYWSGKSPSGERERDMSALPDVPAMQRGAVDLVQRLQTLFAYMERTSRAAVATGDLVNLVPRALVLMASENAPPSVFAEAYLEALATDWHSAAQAEASRLVLSTRGATDPAREELLRAKLQVLYTYALAALPAGQEAEQPPAPQEAQPAACITLLHTALDATVPACLRSKLAGAEGMDSLLITQPADVLLFVVRHRQENGEPLPRFRIDPTVYLDPFLWEHQRGRRIDEDERWREIEAWEAESVNLRTRIDRLRRPGGTELDPLVTRVVRHFALPRDDGEVPAERVSIAERLRRIQDVVRGRLAPLERAYAEARNRAVQAKTQLNAELDARDSAPEMRTVGYDLTSVLLADGTAQWAHVQHHGRWFTVGDGKVHETSEQAACTDERGAADGDGVYLLCYARRGAAEARASVLALPGAPDLGALQAAVEQDNQQRAEEAREKAVRESNGVHAGEAREPHSAEDATERQSTAGGTAGSITDARNGREEPMQTDGLGNGAPAEA